MLGHSYGGMVITGVADQVPERIRRLVYWNAFVPNNGESLNDMVPPPYAALFDQIAAQRGDSSVVLPFPIWREAFINDADGEPAQKSLRHSQSASAAKTFSDKIALKTNPADMQIAKSYINCTEDTRCRIIILASAAVAEARLVPAGSGAGQPRALLLQSETVGAGDHARRARLIR